MSVSERTLLLALLTARTREPQVSDLERFLTVEEALGADAAGAWAVSAAFAVDRASSSDLATLARTSVSRPPPWGMRAVYQAWSNPPLAKLERNHGLDAAAFEAAWAEELERLGRDPRSAALAEVPRVEASLDVEPIEGELRQVRWRIDSPRLERLSVCALLHTSIGPFDNPLDETELTREELPLRRGRRPRRGARRALRHRRARVLRDRGDRRGARAAGASARHPESDRMIALYRKELRALWPLGLLMFTFMAADLFYRPFTERLDERAWEDIASYLEPGDPGVFAYILMTLIAFVAYSAFPREHDERTIELLYALPLRRSSIFFAKVLAGVTVLLLAEAGLTLSDAVQSAFNHQSLSGDHVRLDIALTYLGLELAFCFVVYAHTLVASVLRTLGILPYVLILFFAAVLDDLLPGIAWIDPSELLVARYEGVDLAVPWGPLVLHLIVAVVALAMAYGLWMGPAETIGRAIARVRSSIFGKLTMGCASVLGFAFLALIVASLVAFEPEPEPGAEEASFETAEYETERYTFSYPVSHEARALALADEADRLHTEVQAYLGADRGPKLLADLTDVSGEHLGIASWTHLRVGLVGETDPVRLQRTFTHETVHAFQHRLSDRRQSDAGAAAQFFARARRSTSRSRSYRSRRGARRRAGSAWPRSSATR